MLYKNALNRVLLSCRLYIVRTRFVKLDYDKIYVRVKQKFNAPCVHTQQPSMAN